MSFLYFVPGFDKESLVDSEGRFIRDVLPVELQSVLRDCEKVPEHVSLANVKIFEGGAGGVILAPVSLVTGAPKCVVYSQIKQRWQACCDGYSIGVNLADLPRPESLARFTSLTGYACTDEAARDWIVPVVRMAAAKYGTLPLNFGFEPLTKKTVGHLPSKYRSLWELAGEIWNWYNVGAAIAKDDPTAPPEEDRAASEELSRQPFEWLIDQALILLSQNYRVGIYEINFLNDLDLPLLSRESVYWITKIAIGYDLLMDAKKNSTASLNPATPNSSNSIAGENAPTAALDILPATEH